MSQSEQACVSELKGFFIAKSEMVVGINTLALVAVSLEARRPTAV